MKNRRKEKNTPQLHNGIILSHLNQSSSIFTSPGQGLQCVTNSIMSIIYHNYKNCINWNLTDIKNSAYPRTGGFAEYPRRYRSSDESVCAISGANDV